MPTLHLPTAADAARAIDLWRAQDARLGTLLTRYDDAAKALRHYGLILWEGGNPRAASQALIGAAALQPTDVHIWSDLGGAFAATGARAEAAACLEEAIARGDIRARTFLDLASLRAAAGEAESAMAAYREALTRDPTLGDAAFGLGLAAFEAGRFEECIATMQQAITHGRAANVEAQLCLAKASEAIGRFAEAAAAYERASSLKPDDHDLRRRHARARLVADLIVGPIEPAVARCRHAGLQTKDQNRILEEAFHLLSNYGHPDAAIRIGEYRLVRDPHDEIQAYLLAVLKGEPCERAPAAYLVSYFDQFADDFDQKLTQVLGYDVPQRLAAMLARAGADVRNVLDIGCGTGLVGPCLAQAGRRLCGIDLSPRMLDKARIRGCYDTLVESEAVAYLSTTSARFDAVVAADMLIYLGDLMPVAAGVARVLEPGGVWVFSVETTDAGDRHLLPSGRFAHSPDYVRRVAAASGLETLDVVPATIRLDANRPVQGALVATRRL